MSGEKKNLNNHEDFELRNIDETDSISSSQSHNVDSKQRSCLNSNLLGLKAILFFFYGGIGIISTWLNHRILTKRFTERDTALVYGISSLISFIVPILIGLLSDKTGEPKKVLIVTLLLSTLIYPWMIKVPTSEPYHFKEREAWCNHNGIKCIPYELSCMRNYSELISHYGVCSEGCSGSVVLTGCRYSCQQSDENNENEPNADYDNINITLEASSASASSLFEPRRKIVDGGVDLSFGPEPHICLNTNPPIKYNPICYVFDNEMKELKININDVNGYNVGTKCHYPLLKYSEKSQEFQQLLSCSPLQPNCHVKCDLRWDMSDEWICRNDYNQWLIGFIVFTALHSLGVTLLVTATSLLNAATLSLVHEHEHGEYYGCQIIYGAIGYGLFASLFGYLYQVKDENSFNVPWDVDTILLYTLPFLIPTIIALTLNYNSEWLPKPGSIRPTIIRWTFKSTTIIFFNFILILGCFQGISDILFYYQIKEIGGSLSTVSIGAIASVLPCILFIYKIEKVINFCGHSNIMGIGLVVFCLQFAGFAYLKDTNPNWSYLLKSLDTFSIITVWFTTSYTTYYSAPRSLVGTSQGIVAGIYCCLGRGFGYIIVYIGLSLFTKEYLLKICSICSIIISGFFIIIINFFGTLNKYDLKKKKEVDYAGQDPPGQYKPLQLTSRNDKDYDSGEL